MAFKEFIYFMYILNNLISNELTSITA